MSVPDCASNSRLEVIALDPVHAASALWGIGQRATIPLCLAETPPGHQIKVCTTSSISQFAITVPYVPLSPPLVGSNPQAFSITTRLAGRESRTSPAARVFKRRNRWPRLTVLDSAGSDFPDGSGETQPGALPASTANCSCSASTYPSGASPVGWRERREIRSSPIAGGRFFTIPGSDHCHGFFGSVQNLTKPTILAVHLYR